MHLNLESLVKAKGTFDRFSARMHSDQEKTAAIKAFEMCYELAWKIMKKILQNEGEEIASLKSVFRKAAAIRLISDAEIWFKFNDMRNLGVHAYNEDNIDVIASVFQSFRSEVDNLIKNIQELIRLKDI